MALRREAYLRIAETEDGSLAVMTSLSQTQSGEDLLIPRCDMLVLALAKMLSSADPALLETIPIVQQAYADMAQASDASKAAELFNAVIGIEVYSVEPKQEDAP